MSHAIAVGHVSSFVESLFEDDLHAKRVESLVNATTGALRAGALGIHAIGRGLAAARGTSARHAVKQVDRLLSNDAIDAWALLSSWVPFVVADRTELWVALDWTDFAADKQATLVASAMSSHGRSTPLAWLSVAKADLDGHRAELEEKLLARLKETLPSTAKKVVVIADRGFGDSGRWDAIQALGFDFIIRIKGDVRIKDSNGEDRLAIDWITPSGNARLLRDVRAFVAEKPVASFVGVRAAEMKEGWCLVSSLRDVPAGEIVKAYGRRFTIEESFRDIKDLRFGMGMKSMRISNVKRRDRLLLLSALTIALLTLLGAAGEASGIDRHYKTNTSKKRQLSLFRQGCEYYNFLPTMRDAWAEPLIAKFSELLSAHRIFSETLGLI